MIGIFVFLLPFTSFRIKIPRLSISTIIIIFECILLGVILFFALDKVMQDETGLILNGDMNRIILFFVALMMSVIVAPILNGAIWKKFHYDKIEQIN